MEFEQTEADKSAEISDEFRSIASNRRITVRPIHEEITPEDQPDAVVAAQHILSTPPANIDIDTERTLPPNQTYQDYTQNPFTVGQRPRHTHRVVIVVCIFITLTLIATVTGLYLLR